MPGVAEYRVYFNEHTITQRIQTMSPDDTETADKTEEIPAAYFVSCLSDHEPTDAEWTSMLKEEGYTDERISQIITAE